LLVHPLLSFSQGLDLLFRPPLSLGQGLNLLSQGLELLIRLELYLSQFGYGLLKFLEFCPRNPLLKFRIDSTHDLCDPSGRLRGQDLLKLLKDLKRIDHGKVPLQESNRPTAIIYEAGARTSTAGWTGRVRPQPVIPPFPEGGPSQPGVGVDPLGPDGP